PRFLFLFLALCLFPGLALLFVLRALGSFFSCLLLGFSSCVFSGKSQLTRFAIGPLACFALRPIHRSARLFLHAESALLLSKGRTNGIFSRREFFLDLCFYTKQCLGLGILRLHLRQRYKIRVCGILHGSDIVNSFPTSQ